MWLSFQKRAGLARSHVPSAFELIWDLGNAQQEFAAKAKAKKEPKPVSKAKKTA